VVVIAGLDELLDVGSAVLGPDSDSPLPELGGSAMGFDQLPGIGVFGQGSGSPAVHQVVPGLLAGVGGG
jgi:hypothetical protein